MLITIFVKFRSEVHRGARNEVGTLSPTEPLAGFELRTFQFLSHCLNPLSHSLSLSLSRCFSLMLLSQFKGVSVTFHGYLELLKGQEKQEKKID